MIIHKTVRDCHQEEKLIVKKESRSSLLIAKIQPNEIITKNSILLQKLMMSITQHQNKHHFILTKGNIVLLINRRNKHYKSMKILIVYDSLYGNTEKIAQAITTGSITHEVVLKKANSFLKNELKLCDMLG